MNENSRVEVRRIEDGEALGRFVADMADRPMVGVDLEADSMYHFQEKVCLVQMGVPERVAVIDPLPMADLAALKPFFADPEVEKIFHGADYDIRSLHRDFDITIQNLFDTQIAARFLGFRETGLESVVHRLFHIDLDKRFQKKDWSKRPLPDDMVTYAAQDVIHLVPLAARFKEELKALGRLSWVREECELLTHVRALPSDEAEPLFLRFKGAGRLRPRSLAVLEAILRYRREMARRKDRPLFKIFGNEAILKVVKARPVSLKRLAGSGALSEKQIRMYGEGIVETVRAALEIPEAELPVYPRKKSPPVPPKLPGRVKALKRWRDAKAEALNMDPALVCSKSQISAIAARNPRSVRGLDAVEEMRNWQREAFGREIVSAIKGAAKGKRSR